MGQATLSLHRVMLELQSRHPIWEVAVLVCILQGQQNKDGTLKLDSNTADKAGVLQFSENGTDKWRIGYDATNNYLEFTESGVADRMVITDGGKVGIGLTSMPYSTAATQLSVGDTDTENGGINIVSGTTSLGIIRFADGTAGSDPYRGRIEYDHSSDHLMFGTSGTERMRVNSNGNLLLGTTSDISAGQRLAVKYSYTNPGAAWESDNVNVHNAIVFKNPNGTVGTIRTAASGVQYNTSSDHRLKENVADMTGAIARVKALAPKRFNFIADDTVTVDGFLAHEAQAVVPEAVSGTHNEVDDDGNPVMQGIDQSKLVPLLTGALREAIAKIETLETEMTCA